MNSDWRVRDMTEAQRSDLTLDLEQFQAQVDAPSLNNLAAQSSQRYKQTHSWVATTWSSGPLGRLTVMVGVLRLIMVLGAVVLLAVNFKLFASTLAAYMCNVPTAFGLVITRILGHSSLPMPLHTRAYLATHTAQTALVGKLVWGLLCLAGLLLGRFWCRRSYATDESAG